MNAVIPEGDQVVVSPRAEVMLSDGQVVLVAPLGLRQVRKFSSQIGLIVQVLDKQDLLRTDVETTEFASVADIIMPILTNGSMDIINDCVLNADLLALPHWETPEIIQTWVEMSFGDEGKIRPWISVAASLLMRFTGRVPPILDNPTWLSDIFKPSSKRVTPAKTSSTTSSRTFPTKDGQSHRSGSGSKKPRSKRKSTGKRK